MIAVEAGDFDIVKFLIDKGADINVIWLFRGKTFLCTAISRRDKEVVELLLANGDDPNKKCLTKNTGKSIFTPLRLANLLGYRDIAGLLTANGATETPKTTTKKYIKSAEVMEMLQVSPGTLQNLRINGTLPYSKIGGIILYEYEEILKVLKDNRVAS